MDIDSGKLKQKLIKKLNDSNIFTSKMLEHQRAVGDGIESIIRENITYFFGDVKNPQQSKSKKSMEDFSFYKNKDYYAVDVKTHNLDGDFTMPNLTGIKGLTKFYEVETNHFCLLVVEYRVKDKKLLIENIIFTKLEHIMWDTLQLVNLGLGQVQIKNANIINIDKKQSRKQWITDFYKKAIAFYGKQSKKMTKLKQEYEEKLKKLT